MAFGHRNTITALDISLKNPNKPVKRLDGIIIFDGECVEVYHFEILILKVNAKTNKVEQISGISRTDEEIINTVLNRMNINSLAYGRKGRTKLRSRNPD